MTCENKPDCPCGYPELTFESTLATFIECIDSIDTAILLIMENLYKSAEKSQKELEEFEKNFCDVEVAEKYTEVKVPIAHNKKWRKLRKNFTSYGVAYQIIPQSLFMSLISSYDSFIGSLYRVVLTIKPEIVNASQRNIEFKDLMKFSDLNEARDYVIDKEIESLLRKSHFEQLKELEKIFSLSLTGDKECIKKFVEMTERRNLYAHCNGVPSDQYFENCKKHDCDLSEIRKRDPLRITPKYFFASYDCIYELSVKLTHVLWRKFFEQDRKNADVNLINIGYSLIEERRYGLACKILDFACTVLPKYSSEANKLIFIINRAQAYKWRKNSEKAIKILGEIDWSAKSNEFKLANYVLTEDWDSAKKTMEAIGTSFQAKQGYIDWPLYKEFRKTTEFLETYKKIFGEEFSSETVTHDVINPQTHKHDK